MKNDYPCSLIKDILPIYNDAATGSETNEIIEEHLKSCDDCLMYLDAIKESEIKLPNKEEEIYRYVKIAQRIKRRKMITVLSVVMLFVFALAVLFNMFTPILVSGDSMSPTTQDGEIVWLNKLAYAFSSPQRLDVVAYQRDDMLVISRIIAFPNEIVKVTDGVIYANNIAIDYSFPSQDFDLDEFSINEGHYFIIKDNADDLSTIPQLVSTKNIVGRFRVR